MFKLAKNSARSKTYPTIETKCKRWPMISNSVWIHSDVLKVRKKRLIHRKTLWGFKKLLNQRTKHRFTLRSIILLRTSKKYLESIVRFLVNCCIFGWPEDLIKQRSVSPGILNACIHFGTWTIDSIIIKLFSKFWI